jgi:hypothetical protein
VHDMANGLRRTAIIFSPCCKLVLKLKAAQKRIPGFYPKLFFTQ